MKRLISSLLVLAVCAGPSLSDEKSNKAALEAAYKKQRELFSRYQALQKKVSQDAELQKLRKLSNEASDALKKKLDALSVKERQAEQAVRDRLNAAIAKQIASNKEIARLNGLRRSIEKKKRDLRFEIGLLQTRLHHSDSPLQQELDADPELAPLRQAMLKAKSKERRSTYKKYYDARRAKLAKLKGAKPLLAQVEKLNQEIRQLDKQSYEASRSIFATRRKIEYGKDDSLQPLRDQLVAARKVTRQVHYHAEAKELRTAANNASRAYQKRMQELTSANKGMTSLQKQLNAVYKEIRELQPRPKSTRKPARSKRPGKAKSKSSSARAKQS